MSEVAARLQAVLQAIEQTAEQCGRDPSRIRLLAVSKTFSAGRIAEARHSGQRYFGENRVQEAEAKIPQVQEADLEWHLIGHLQSNKAHRAVELFDVIQTLDSEKIIRRVARACAEFNKRLPVYIEVNVADEPRKFGVGPRELEAAVSLVDSCPQLQLQGLMTLPPFEADPERARPYFRKLAQLQQALNQGRERPLMELSMGMSHDFRVAIEEGATLLRIGTAIFGERE